MRRHRRAELALEALIRVRSHARWRAGALIATLRYLTGTLRIERHEETVVGPDRGRVDRPVPGAQAAAQTRCDGTDASLRRSYLYDWDAPLENRNMLLEGGFAGLRFLFGVRIVRVVDDTMQEDGRPVRRCAGGAGATEPSTATSNLEVHLPGS